MGYDSERPCLVISISRRDYWAVGDILEMFVRWGYFKREDCTVSYDDEKKMYNIDICDIKLESAAFIGDILEAAVGHDLEWFHHQFGVDDEEDEE